VQLEMKCLSQITQVGEYAQQAQRTRVPGCALSPRADPILVLTPYAPNLITADAAAEAAIAAVGSGHHTQPLAVATIELRVETKR